MISPLLVFFFFFLSVQGSEEEEILHTHFRKGDFMFMCI